MFCRFTSILKYNTKKLKFRRTMSEKTVILKFNDYEKEEEIFAKCAKHLKEGNLVSFPTVKLDLF
jgi:hypothetical protein